MSIKWTQEIWKVKNFLGKILVFVVVLVLITGAAHASWTFSWINGGGKISWLKAVWVAAANGSVAEPTDTEKLGLQQSYFRDKYIWKVYTIPDSETAPTANYDFTLKDFGIDVLEGACADRSDSTTELVSKTTAFPAAPVFGITGNLVGSASGTVVLLLVGD